MHVYFQGARPGVELKNSEPGTNLGLAFRPRIAAFRNLLASGWDPESPGAVRFDGRWAKFPDPTAFSRRRLSGLRRPRALRWGQGAPENRLQVDPCAGSGDAAKHLRAAPGTVGGGT